MKNFNKFIIAGLALFAFSCEKDSNINSTTVTDSISNRAAAVVTPKKFLFDAKKAETAGNADWVLDADSSPQRFPTPLQATITATTPETYWKGGVSAWGIALVKLGHTVETLPSSASITYGTTAAQDLKNYDVYVVDEPNIRFTTAEKTAIMNFVKNGGGLFMISDHTASDRNNDGWDSPAIWNDLMSNNTVQNNPFGFSINLNTFSETTSNRLAITTNPILNGTQGIVSQIKYSAGASITTNTAANASVQGLIWRGTSTQGSTNVMCASANYMLGRVVIIGDSSPADDGTGATGDTLYPGWTELASHSRLHMNASLWLAKL
jgi:hypothetical protein